LDARSPARKPLLQTICPVRLDQRDVVDTELRAGRDSPPARLAVPEPRCATREHRQGEFLRKRHRTATGAEWVLARTYRRARGSDPPPPLFDDPELVLHRPTNKAAWARLLKDMRARQILLLQIAATSSRRLRTPILCEDRIGVVFGPWSHGGLVRAKDAARLDRSAD